MAQLLLIRCQRATRPKGVQKSTVRPVEYARGLVASTAFLIHCGAIEWPSGSGV